ncbi:MAG: WYL domain-containing protein [Clostridia bacterium]|nr:WYL domain-containing protein [Clostridia bacterium]
MHTGKKRLLYLLKIFYNTDIQHPRTAFSLCMTLRAYGIDTCLRTIGSDVAALREAGYPIAVHPQRSKGYYLARHALGGEELRLLCDMAAAAPYLPLADTRKLLKKLEALASPTAVKTAQRGRVMDTVRKPAEGALSHTLALLNAAILRGLRVCFRCDGLMVGAQGGQSCVISPYYTAARDGQYYVLGNLEGRDDLSAFRLADMRAPVLSPLPIRPYREVTPLCDPRFYPAEYLRAAVGLCHGPSVTLSLLCRAEARDVIAAQFGAITRKPAKEGYFRVEADVFCGPALYGWLLQHADVLTVLGPAQVRDGVKLRLLASLAALEAEKT